MKHRCARAVCNAVATGAFVTNVPECTAWLVGVGQFEGAVPLCEMHLSRFSVPVGWTLITDQAPTSARPFESVPNVDVAPAIGADVEPDVARDTPPHAPTPDDDAVDASAEAPDAKTATHLWSDADGDDEAAVQPASPLLSRAFKGPDDETGDQRRLAIFKRSTRSSPAEAPKVDNELPFPPADDSPLVNGQ